MGRRVMIAAAGIVVAVVLVGVFLLLRDSDDESSEERDPTTPTTEPCDGVVEAVTASQDLVGQLTGSTQVRRDADFFALVVTEQRTITYVMEERPDCFTLIERARADGLYEAFTGLLAIADPADEDVSTEPPPGFAEDEPEPVSEDQSGE